VGTIRKLHDHIPTRCSRKQSDYIVPQPRILRLSNSLTRYNSINKHSVSPKDTLRHHSHFANYMKAHNQKHDYVTSKCLSLTDTHSNLVRIISSSTHLYDSLIKVNSFVSRGHVINVCSGQEVTNSEISVLLKKKRVWGQRHAPASLHPRERPGTHCTGGWVGPRADLDRCGKSRLHRDSISGRSSP